MVNFTVQQIREGMSRQTKIRNLSVIAHVDHGKTTLTDSFIARAGLINSNEAGEKCWTDGMKQEQERGITIVSTGVTLLYSLQPQITKESENTEMLINLIDSPGHIDFSAEVTAALRVTDGALVVVDSVEGPRVQTETVLRQALTERIKPVLVINKIDRLIFDLNKDEEQIYTTFDHVIDKVNAIISTVAVPKEMGTVTVNPSLGTVCFASAKMGFGFTLTKFASIFAKKIGITEDVFMRNLWGNHFIDPKTKSFTTKSTGADGKPLQRVFNFVMRRFLMLTQSILNMDQEKYDQIAPTMEAPKANLRDFSDPRAALEAILKRWMPISDALLEMVYHHLPSPVDAQKYRVDNLYTGPLDDPTANAIRTCDPNGPLCMFVSKMVPAPDGNRFYAFGRVFSGTIKTGQRVRIIARETKWATTGTLVVWMGNKYSAIEDAPCGSTVAILGIEDYILKSGTLVSEEDAHPIIPMKFSVAPVVRVAVRPKNNQDRTALISGLAKLSKFDQCLQYSTNESSEIVVAGVGELHIEVLMRQLVEQFAKVEIITSEPVVSFRETIRAQSQPCLAKSQNKLNRLMCSAAPLGDDLVEAIEKCELTQQTDPKTRAKLLIDKFGWEQNDAKKVWALSSEVEGNVLTDASKGLETLHEVREYITDAFQNVCMEGPLCGEPVVGAKFSVVDAVLHSDTSHRGSGQIMPAARKSFNAAVLAGDPALLEPIYHIEVTIPQDLCGPVHTVLSRHRGQVIDQTMTEGSTTIVIHALLPVAESFGIDKELRTNTSGRAFSTMSFSHWALVDGDAYTPGNRLSDIVRSIRKRKGLTEDPPTPDKFIDRL